MRVTTGNNPYAHQQQRTNNKDKGGFADMLANMAANKSGKTEASGDGDRRTRPDSNDFLHGANPHRCHDTENKLRMGQLTLAKTPNTAELVECKAPDPKYPASIYDIPASELATEVDAARMACSYLDTEGLSKAEIYNRIESIFKDYLGKDFKEPYVVYSDAVRSERGSHLGNLSDVNFTFREELNKVGINLDADSEILREARGYSGMSENEMRAAVREKYPEEMTLKDCIVMAEELWRLGVEDGNYGYCVKDRIFSTLNLDTKRYGSQIEEIYNTMLEMPANYDSIKTAYDNFAKDDYNSYPTHNMDDTISSLLSWFGGNEFGGGALLSKLREILDEMEKEGILGFDEFGYCRSPEKV